MLAAGTLILDLVSPASGWGWGDSCVSCIPLLRMEKQLLGRCPSPLWCFPLVLKEDCFQRPLLLLCCVFQHLPSALLLGAVYQWLTPFRVTDCILLFIETFLCPFLVVCLPQWTVWAITHPSWIQPAPLGSCQLLPNSVPCTPESELGPPRPQVFGWWQQ